jgi:chaperone required for assembly of F1-ATPase
MLNGKLNHLNKFYKQVSIIRLDDTNFSVTLDNKKLKTPERNIVKTPSFEVAHLIQNEFRSQTDYIIPATLPMVSLIEFNLLGASIDVTKNQIHLEHSRHRIEKFLLGDTIRFDKKLPRRETSSEGEARRHLWRDVQDNQGEVRI